MNTFNLLEKQIAALKVFRTGALLSANQLANRLCIVRTNAQLRIDELRDKGLLKKNNATQFSISPKGLAALESIEADTKDESAAVEVEAVEDVELSVQVAPEVEPEKDNRIHLAGKLYPEIEPVTLAFQAQEVAIEEQTPAKPHKVLEAIERLQGALTKPKPFEIKDLELKKEVLVKLGQILEHSITDVLIAICDDLDRAAGNEV